MIIERVRARGFGLFEVLDVELGPQLTVVHGPNETGKTTLAETIFAALYGAHDTSRARAKERLEVTRFKPWAGGDFTVALEVALTDGTRLAVVRRLGQKKDDLTVTDLATGQDLAKPGEPGGAALELLSGVSAELFRASVLISDLPTGPLDGQALHQRFQNLGTSGEETVSVERALDLIRRQLDEIGRTDQPGQTKVGQAISAHRQLEGQIAQLDERRQAVLAEQADLAEKTRRAAELEAALLVARGRLRATQRWVAEERQRALAETSAQIAALEAEIAARAGLEQVDREDIARLGETASRLEAEAAQERQLAAALAEEAKTPGAEQPTPSRQWLEAAWRALDEQGSARPGRVWWRWLPAAVVLVAAIWLAVSGDDLFALIALLVAVGSALWAWRASGRVGQGGAAPGLAREAGQAQLTLELVRAVEGNWRRFEQEVETGREKLAEAGRLEESARTKTAQAAELNAHLTSLVGALGEGETLADLDAKLEHLAERRRELLALRDRQHRLLDLPEATRQAWLALAEDPVAGDLAALEDEVGRLEEELARVQGAVATLAAALQRWLGEGVDLPELEAACQRAAELVARRQEERQAMELAAARLSEVGAEFQRQVGPELSTRMGAWLERLSGGRYNQATGADQGAPRISGPGEVALRAPEELSQGTQDLLYISLRLALSELLFPGEPVPLILDEPSAHLDPERHSRLLAGLQEIARSRQVVVLTCHPWERDALAEAGATVWEPGADSATRIRR